MAERATGYYWIRYFDEWMPAEWAEGVWWVIGGDEAVSENDIDEVGAHLPTPAAVRPSAGKSEPPPGWETER